MLILVFYWTDVASSEDSLLQHNIQVEIKKTYYWKIQHWCHNPLMTYLILFIAFWATKFITTKTCKGAFYNYVDKMRGKGVKKCQRMAKFCPRRCWMPPNSILLWLILGYKPQVYKECEQCGRCFQGPNAIRDLTNHMKKHNKITITICHFCNRDYKTKKKLNDHKKRYCKENLTLINNQLKQEPNQWMLIYIIMDLKIYTC